LFPLPSPVAVAAAVAAVAAVAAAVAAVAAVAVAAAVVVAVVVALPHLSPFPTTSPQDLAHLLLDIDDSDRVALAGGVGGGRARGQGPAPGGAPDDWTGGLPAAAAALALRARVLDSLADALGAHPRPSGRDAPADGSDAAAAAARGVVVDPGARPSDDLLRRVTLLRKGRRILASALGALRPAWLSEARAVALREARGLPAADPAAADPAAAAAAADPAAAAAAAALAAPGLAADPAAVRAAHAQASDRVLWAVLRCARRLFRHASLPAELYRDRDEARRVQREGDLVPVTSDVAARLDATIRALPGPTEVCDALEALVSGDLCPAGHGGGGGGGGRGDADADDDAVDDADVDVADLLLPLRPDGDVDDAEGQARPWLGTVLVALAERAAEVDASRDPRWRRLFDRLYRVLERHLRTVADVARAAAEQGAASAAARARAEVPVGVVVALLGAVQPHVDDARGATLARALTAVFDADG